MKKIYYLLLCLLGIVYNGYALANEEQVSFSVSNLSNGTYPIVVNQNGVVSADVLVVKH